MCCAILQLVDSLTSSTPFDQSSFSSAQKFSQADVENSLNFIRIMANNLMKINAAMVQVYPANDIAFYKRLASQIISDQGKRFSQESLQMAQDSNKDPMRRLKEEDVQFDITGMFPVIKSSGQYYNIQSDMEFNPTVYRLGDPHVIQQRVFFLVAASECLMLKYDEPTAAAVCISIAHQF